MDPARLCLAVLTLLGLLLSPALRVGAEAADAAPAGGGEGAAAKPAGESASKPAPREEKEKRRSYPIGPRVSRYLAKSLKLMQANQLPEAQALLERIGGNSRLNPGERGKILQFLGNVAVYQSRFPDATKLLAEAIETRGLDLASEQQVTFQLASLYAQLEEYPEAMEVLDRWFRQAEQPTPEAFYLKAAILVQMERPEDAVPAAEQAVALTPNPREGWLSLLAHVYYLVKNYPKMAATLETLIERVPNKKSYWMLLSAAYFELDRDDDARAVVQLANRQKLLDQDRELRALARLLLGHALPYECAGVLEKAMADGVVPEQKDSYELLTNCWLQARQGDRALEPLARGAELSDDARLYLLLGKVHLQSGRHDEALAALNRGLAKATPDQRGRVYLLIGVAQLGANRLDEAERAFRSASSDAGARSDAESYLKFVTQERERRREMGA